MQDVPKNVATKNPKRFGNLNVVKRVALCIKAFQEFRLLTENLINPRLVFFPFAVYSLISRVRLFLADTFLPVLCLLLENNLTDSLKSVWVLALTTIRSKFGHVRTLPICSANKHHRPVTCAVDSLAACSLIVGYVTH